MNSLDSMEVGLRTQISTEKLESMEMEIEGLQLSLEKERNRIKSEIKDLVHSKGFKHFINSLAPDFDSLVPHFFTRLANGSQKLTSTGSPVVFARKISKYLLKSYYSQVKDSAEAESILSEIDSELASTMNSFETQREEAISEIQKRRRKKRREKLDQMKLENCSGQFSNTTL